VNVHHLEIFYHVARHGGISEAVRKFPYGIQQPAVSSQILQLEQSLGTRLFQRRPFRLTAAGERLYAFIRPFFANLEKVATEILGDSSQLIRIGASGAVLHLHLPRMLREIRKTIPRLRFSLLEAGAPRLIEALKQDEIDLAVTTLQGPIPVELKSRPLVQLPLTLLLPKTTRLRSATELWKREGLEYPLICLPAHEPISANFQRGLAKLGVEWIPSLVVSSMNLIETYVAEGFGIGVSAVIPGAKSPPTVRQLPLPGFDGLDIGIIWGGQESPLVHTFIAAIEKQAGRVGRTVSRGRRIAP
jgi:DNA-binding transcriptional LysR family regulator